MLFLLGLAVCVGLAVAAQNVTVESNDPRITYVGNWTDQDGGGHKFGGTGASLSFTFQGTAIYWHGAINPNGATAQVSVDGSTAIVDASAGAKTGQAPVLAVLFSRDGLNGTQSHTFSLARVGPGALGGPYMELYSLEFTQADSAATSQTSSVASTLTKAAPSGLSTSPSASNLATLTSSGFKTVTNPVSGTNSVTSQGSAGHGNGGIIGGAVGGVLGALTLIAVAIFMVRRRRQVKSTIAPYATQGHQGTPVTRPSKHAGFSRTDPEPENSTIIAESRAGVSTTSHLNGTLSAIQSTETAFQQRPFPDTFEKQSDPTPPVRQSTVSSTVRPSHAPSTVASSSAIPLPRYSGPPPPRYY